MPFAIRCHPLAPVESAEIEDWLEVAVERLSDDQTRMHVLRLTQHLPSGRELTGWLIELAGDDAPDDPAIESLISEMRLLGLEPTVLEPARGTRVTVVS